MVVLNNYLKENFIEEKISINEQIIKINNFYNNIKELNQRKEEKNQRKEEKNQRKIENTIDIQFLGNDLVEDGDIKVVPAKTYEDLNLIKINSEINKNKKAIIEIFEKKLNENKNNLNQENKDYLNIFYSLIIEEITDNNYENLEKILFIKDINEEKIIEISKKLEKKEKIKDLLNNFSEKITSILEKIPEEKIEYYLDPIGPFFPFLVYLILKNA